MRIRYSHTYWGSDHLSPEEFVRKIVEAGYDGMELFLQPGTELCSRFMQALSDIRKEIPDFRLILLQIEFPGNEGFDAYMRALKKNVESLAALEPDFINSHTGADYFSFDQNCRALELLSELSERTSVPVYHETHRGRFSFHAPTLMPYLEKFPQMQLVGDLSHFCTVSESMLAGQEELLKMIFPRIAHVHARIGFEQGPQVNNPSAPEWENHRNHFVKWWKEIADARKARGEKLLTFTTEFGPPPYLPEMPFSREPVSNQWENNLYMLSLIKAHFGNDV